tara:strand:- start:361 stop:615 length:255 start_codon:yes stop_codon:yes gene_type:complete
MGGSWFNNELFTLGFFIVEGLIVGISWMLVYRDSDKLFADAPPDKAPIRSMFWMFWGHVILMNIALVFIFFIAIVLNILWAVIS